MQSELVPKLHPSIGYESIVTAMVVLTHYLLACLTFNQDTKTVAITLNTIKTKHPYLTTTLIPDEGSAFVSYVIKEVAGVLGVILKQDTLKPAQTIGRLERSHTSINQTNKQRLKQASGDHCGINTSVLRSLITMLLITQALAKS